MGEDGPGRGHLYHTDTFLVLILLNFYMCIGIPAQHDLSSVDWAENTPDFKPNQMALVLGGCHSRLFMD